MPDVPLVVPQEYREAGITTPEAAADYSSDIIGFMSCHRAHDSAVRAEKRGALGEAAFYWAVLAILLEWYNKAPEPVTGDEDLLEFGPDEPEAAPVKPATKPRRAPAPRPSKRIKKRGRTKRTSG